MKNFLVFIVGCWMVSKGTGTEPRSWEALWLIMGLTLMIASYVED